MMYAFYTGHCMHKIDFEVLIFTNNSKFVTLKKLAICGISLQHMQDIIGVHGINSW